MMTIAKQIANIVHRQTFWESFQLNGQRSQNIEAAEQRSQPANIIGLISGSKHVSFSKQSLQVVFDPLTVYQQLL